MKQTISSPIRKLKLLLVLPLIAGVFYAFGTPEYKLSFSEQQQVDAKNQQLTANGCNQSLAEEVIIKDKKIPDEKAKEQERTKIQKEPTSQASEKMVKGKVVDANEKPLEGASIVIKGKATGIVSYTVPIEFVLQNM